VAVLVRNIVLGIVYLPIGFVGLIGMGLRVELSEFAERWRRAVPARRDRG